MKFSRLALLGTASLAFAQHHNHAHRHPAKRGSPVEKRDTVTVVAVDPATVTVYELNGEFLDWTTVEAGLKAGIYVLMGDSISTVVPASSSTPTPTPSSSAAIFFQEHSTTTTPTSTYVPPKTTAAPPPATTTSASSTSSSSAGNWPDFVSGKTPCHEFPSQFGPVAADWLNLGGYTGVQTVNNDFSFGISAAISYISTGIAGTGCVPNSFCSYACPAGYQKSQWPAAQGSTGQSVGGLYCGTDGYLHLSRESNPQLCTPGTGTIFVKNTLSSGDNVPICRTDYPGTESETIALNVEPGTVESLTCPDAASYYVWENSYTSAQYYVNPAGTSVGDACVWGSAGSNVGNWAPVNIGVGKAITGETFISMFPNAPTNTYGKLNFNIEIDGGVSGKCTYEDGVFYSNGAVSSTGCTVSDKNCMSS
jgi:hypothetical protein